MKWLSWLLFAIAALLSALLLVIVVATPLDVKPQMVLGGIVLLVALILNRLKGRLITQFLTVISIAVSSRYLWWRLTSTLDFDSTIDYVFGYLLFAAESYAFVILLLGYFQTIGIIARKPVQLPPDLDKWPTVDVYIPSFNEPLEVVRPTILAALALDWPADKLTVHLLDDGKRADFRDFAAKAKCNYITRPDSKHAKAGNLNHALKITKGELIAIFDADHVAARSFLQLTVGMFLKDPKLAIVQTPHHFYNADPIERNSRVFRTVPSEGTLFYGLIQAGNDFWNATFFCGSCAVIRRKPLEEVGGVATESLTEDALTSLKIQRNGYNTAYLNIRQAGGLATESLAGHVGQRVRWAQGMAQILRVSNPLLGRGLALGQRLCYLNSILHFLYGLPRVVFLTAPLVFLLLGAHICNASAIMLVAYAVPHLAHSTLTNSRTKGKVRYSFWADVYETVLATYIFVPTLIAILNPKAGAFKVTAKGGVTDHEGFDKKVARPYVVLLMLNILGVMFGFARLLLWDYYEPGTVLINLAWTVFNLIMIGAALGVAWELRQVRRTHRVDMKLHAMVETADGHTRTAETRNISLGGASIQLDGEFDLVANDETRVTFFVDDRAHSMPARVLDVENGLLRLIFEHLTLREESQLVQVIFGRPDSWIDWDKNISHDRPIWSFRTIVVDGIDAIRKVASVQAGWIWGGTLVSAAAAMVFLMMHTGWRITPVVDRIQSVVHQVVDTVVSVAKADEPATGKVPPHKSPPLPSDALTSPPPFGTAPRGADSPLSTPGAPGAPFIGQRLPVAAPPVLVPMGDLPAPEGEWNKVLLADLGMTEYVPRKWQGLSVTLEHRIPPDRVITEARLRLPLITPRAGADRFNSLTILVNGVLVSELTVAEMALGGSAHEIVIDPRLFGVQNDLTFILGLSGNKEVDPACLPPAAWLADSHDIPTCPCVPPGTWSLIERSASLETRTVRLNRPNDLSELPAFLGDTIAGRARIPFVFAAAPSLPTLRSGFLLAAWFGLAGRHAEALTPAEQLPTEDPRYWRNNLRVARFRARDLDPQELDFPVTFGALPKESGVVLGLSSDLPRLGLLPVDGPSVQVIENPAAPGKKLLVISARSDAELTVLIERMASERSQETRGMLRGQAYPAAYGKSQNIAVAPTIGPDGKLDERLGPGRLVHFSELPGGDKLMIRGRNDGMMKVQFGLAPGTFFWPHAGMPVTLVYDQVLASRARQSKMVIEVNGRFVTIIQRANALHSTGPKEVKFTLPQVFLGARNEMVIYSEFEAETEECPDDHPDEYTVVSGDSTFDLRSATEFATLPDLSRLAWEGYPYSRKADLSETVVVVPSPLSHEAASTILSVGAHLARTSGSSCVGVDLMRPEGLTSGLDKDLIVVGTYESQPLARRWLNNSPALAHTGGIEIRDGDLTERVLKAIAGRDVADETAQAMFDYQGTHGTAGLVTSFESPLHPGRTVVLLTATRDAALPNLSSLANSAAVRDRRSDTVLSVPGATHAYRFGGSYGVGQIGSVKQALWFFSVNSFLLLPLLLIGALVIGFVLLTFVAARERRRLAL